MTLRCKYCQQEIVLERNGKPSFIGDIDRAKEVCMLSPVPHDNPCLMDVLMNDAMADGDETP